MSTTNDVAEAVKRLENHLIPYGMSIGGEGVTDIRTILARLTVLEAVAHAAHADILDAQAEQDVFSSTQIALINKLTEAGYESV